MKSKFHHSTLTAVVIANMIGTGSIHESWFSAIRNTIWICHFDALGIRRSDCCFWPMTYAELGAALQRSGGEYNS